MDRNSFEYDAVDSRFMVRLEEHFRILTDKTVLRDNIEEPGMTYGELDDISGRVYSYLRNKGIGREDTVVLCLKRSVRVPAAVIGIWKAGASVVICADSYPEERIRYICDDCSCRLMINEGLWPDIMTEEYMPGRETVGPHDLAYTVYTSGTTGAPKGAMHEFGNLDESSVSQAFEGKNIIQESDTLAMNSPVTFVVFMTFLTTVLYAGATMFIVDRAYVRDTDALIGLYESAAISCTFMTPSLFNTLTKLNPQLRWVILGGEPTVNIYRSDVTLYNIFGMSELGFSTAVFRIDRPYGLTPVGRNQTGRELHLLDENGREAADGEMGELCLVNDFVRGYRNLPEETKKHWHDGLFFTGDIGRRLQDGNIELLGRNDDMIKINGNRIEPAEIESAARKALVPEWAAAKGFVDGDHAFTVLYYTKDEEIDAEEGRRKLSELLPDYMLPAYFVRLNEPPVLPSGKTDRSRLIMPDTGSYRRKFAPAETELQQKLLDAAERILGSAGIGIDDDFFELGGDSLRTIELVTELKDPAVTAQMIYEHRTVRRISEAASALSAGSSLSPDEKERCARHEDQPFLPMQLHLLDNQLSCMGTDFLGLHILWRMPSDQMDTDRLAEALKTLVKHHAALQSVARLDEDRLFVMHFDPKHVPEVTVERISEEDFLSGMSGLPQRFQILEAPMYRFRIFETDENTYLLTEFNHLFSDGYSALVFFRNLSDVYHGRELAPDYAYLHQQDTWRRWKGSQGVKARRHNIESYGHTDWCRVITPDMESRNNHASWIQTGFPVSADRLHDYLEKKRMTLNALCVAASLMAIHEYEDKSDVMVSWAYHGRDDIIYNSSLISGHKELPVAVSFDSIGSADELIEEVKKQISEGLLFQDDPYITETTSVGVNDAFRVRCLDVLELDEEGIEGIQTETVPLPVKDSGRSLMSLQVKKEKDGEYTLSLSYADRRYYRQSAARFFDHLSESIERLVRDGDKMRTCSEQ